MMRGSGRQARQAGLHLRTARARTAQARCKRRRRTRERSVSGCRGAAHWQPIPRTPGGASARTLRGDAARSICAACARRVPCPDKHWGQQRKGRARALCGRRKKEACVEHRQPPRPTRERARGAACRGRRCFSCGGGQAAIRRGRCGSPRPGTPRGQW
jgi:hypothetical protein